MVKNIIASVAGFLIVLITTIIIILYAKGYTYDFSSKKIETTGVIKITSTPSDAQVYINGSYKGQTPFSLFNLSPQAYTIQVKKDGYLEWSTKQSVIGGQILPLYPILYPIQLTPERIETTALIDKTFVTNHTYLYSTKDTHGFSIYMHSFGTSFLHIGEGTSMVFTSTSIGQDYTLNTIMPSPNENKLLCALTLPNGTKAWYIIDTRNTYPPQTLDSLIDTTVYPTIFWGTDDNHLYLANNQTIISLSLSNSQKILAFEAQLNQQIESYSVNTDAFYIVTKDKAQQTLYSVNTDGTNTTVLAKGTGIKSIASGNIYAYSISDNGISFVGGQSAHIQGVNIKPISISRTNKLVLYEDANQQLFTYDIETSSTYGLGINMKDIDFITWGHDDHTLFYTIKKDQQFYLHAIEYTGTNGALLFTQPLLQPDILVSPNNNQIFFSSSTENHPGLYSITLTGN